MRPLILLLRSLMLKLPDVLSVFDGIKGFTGHESCFVV